MKKLPFAFAAAAILAALPAAAAEEAGPEFGDPGIINFAAATNLDVAFGSRKPPNGGDSTSTTHIEIQPSIDYFVIQNLSIGVLLGFDTSSSKPSGGESSSDTTLSFGPRVGYNVWLTPGQLSLWPQLSFLYASTSSKDAGKDGPTFTAGAIDILVPLVIHPVKHFHFAVGPFARFDVISKASQDGTSVDGPKSTVFGLRGEIAGWL
jgi:hypothetical protein